MCGIAGIYNFRSKAADDKKYMHQCMHTMRRRGPDSDGIWNDENYITGFVRLAIRDTSEYGNQPMLSSCGNYCITFNGEIYNAEAFRAKLINKGVQFASTSDTEILLYSLIHFGIEKVLAAFDGIFAFLFYNREKNELLAARDRIGVKPFYVGFDNKDAIIFSSQYDHVINYRSLKQQPLDFGAIGAYLQLGFIPDNLGAVKNTFLFPHGYYATVNADGFSLKKYFLFITGSIQKDQLLTENIFADAAVGQLVSDVPVGTYLSGGVDSSLITLWVNNHQPIQAFTIGTDDAFTNEREAASMFAKANDIKHFIYDISENDLLKLVSDNFIAHTEPFADFSSLPSLLLSQIAGEYCKVILSGDGPDELFWGYGRNVKYLNAGKKYFGPSWKLYAELMYSKIKGKNTIIDKRMLGSEDFFQWYYQSMFIYGSNVVPSLYIPECSVAFFLEEIKSAYQAKNIQDDFMYAIRDMEMNIHLQRILLKVDRAGMYNSVEVRVPYLSNEILDRAMKEGYQWNVKKSEGKYFLKHLLAEKMNKEFAFKHKKGFLVPMKNWLRESLKKDVEEKLLSMPAELQSAFDIKELEKILNIHMIEKRDLSGIIWAIYALVNWYHSHRNNQMLAA